NDIPEQTNQQAPQQQPQQAQPQPQPPQPQQPPQQMPPYQQYQQYQQNQQYNMQNPNNKFHPKKGFCITSLVLGILSIAFSCIPFVPFICGVVGLILGIMGQKAGSNGLAIAGIITSSFGIIFGLFMTVSYIVLISTGKISTGNVYFNNNYWEQIYDNYSPYILK
ncbi:MAG: DUF4190 domain-containing protein, partial [Oscillospiraceae bacterium]